MPDAPIVTVSDPSGDDGRGDLLQSGDEHAPWRPSRRTAGLTALALLLAAGGVVGVRAEQRDREQQRLREAAFALADRVRLRSSLAGVVTPAVGSRRLAFLVDLLQVGVGDSGPRDRVTGLRVEGAGLTPDPTPFVEVVAGPVEAAATVDCRAAAAGQLPERATVVLTVVPASEVEHVQRLQVGAALLRQAVLEACDLPDPGLRTTVATFVQGRTLTLLVDTVPRSRRPATVQSVAVAGFDVRTVGAALPYSVSPGSGAFLGLQARVVDCAAARAGDLGLQVRLTDDEGSAVRTAADAAAEQPGRRPTRDLLQDLLARDC